MPSTHATAYLGAFVLDDESHHNLGEAGHLIDMRAFVPDAVQTLGNLLRIHAEGTQGST